MVDTREIHCRPLWTEIEALRKALSKIADDADATCQQCTDSMNFADTVLEKVSGDAESNRRLFGGDAHAEDRSGDGEARERGERGE